MQTRLKIYFLLSFLAFGILCSLGTFLSLHLMQNFEDQVLIQIGFTLVIIMPVSFGIGIVFGNWITSIFMKLESAFKEVGLGNLGVQIQYHKNDIFKDFYHSFHRMILAQSELIQHIKTSASTLSNESVEMKKITSEFALNLQSQSAATEEVSASIEEISGVATFISNIANENKDSMSDLKEKVESLSTAIDETADTVNETLTSIQVIIEKAESGKTSLKLMNDAMENLTSSSTEISRTVDIINKISEQVNMLALNASIEAARAGDAGRGFAVVADEVSKLAERTASAVKSIDLLIKKNQKDVELGRERIESTTSEIQSIIGTIDVISSHIEEVKNAIISQKNVEGKLFNLAQFVKERSDEIKNAVNEHKTATNEVMVSVSSISEISFKNSEQSEFLADNLNQFGNATEKLISMVNLFKTNATVSHQNDFFRDSKTHRIEYSSEIGDIYYVPNHHLIEVVWKPDYSDEGYKSILLKALEIIDKWKISKWLADTRQIGLVSKSGQDWVNLEWFPKASNSTLRKMAVVLPESALSAISIEDTTLKTGLVEMKSVPNMEAAWKWLA
ncbi:methyl-accepting chemotaxis protein [Leptospira levettii]|uniref:methyl-accepting chemotaxis protein n=1 Tax=Leptospira levettii TaxID=2023178 RepID=UPI001EE9B584|nr:methyl-accepting chemotaxis protein [Leptospira levettii]MCG6148319.1 methyl-accepting chemotaxis protein [Leptospira levettii]